VPQIKTKGINAVIVTAADASIYTVEDATSIAVNSRIQYQAASNPLILNLSDAKRVGDWIFANYKTDRGLFISEWQGNPALELSDNFNLTDLNETTTNCIVVSQTIEYGNGLRITTTGRSD